MGRRQRHETTKTTAATSTTADDYEEPAAKRIKTASTPQLKAVAAASSDDRPKSRKELRAERKAAKRAAQPKTAQQVKAERKRLAQQRRKQEEKEQFKQLLKQERQEKKLRQQQKQRRQENSKKKTAQSTAAAPSRGAEEQDMALRLVHEIKYGRTDAASGMTTLAMGVQYKDIVVGKGPVVQPKSLVTVKYRLTGGKLGALIDSSNKFNFRVGKGEVIQGWDIGLQGMQVGGRRQLIVPPKAGYGSQDIGAGPGGILHFDITLLDIRG